MATIRASCGECGDVELTTDDVHVRVCTGDSQGTYSFRCPVCLMTVIKPAEARTVDLLVASGVSYETWTLPLELSEPRGTGTRPSPTTSCSTSTTSSATTACSATRWPSCSTARSGPTR